MIMLYKTMVVKIYQQPMLIVLIHNLLSTEFQQEGSLG